MPVSEIIDLFYQMRDPQRAAAMTAYMKGNFPFLGIAKPERAKLQSDFIKKARRLKHVDWDLVNTLWVLPEREFQYLAIDYLVALKKLLQAHDADNIEVLLTSKSWWDTVDILASSVVGHLFLNRPQLISSHILNWARSENIWLARAAILFQLKYKEKTDVHLLAQIISWNLNSKEFFINKAIGWTLREYSKTNRTWVRTFLAQNHLHPLSIREASKYL